MSIRCHWRCCKEWTLISWYCAIFEMICLSVITSYVSNKAIFVLHKRWHALSLSRNRFIHPFSSVVICSFGYWVFASVKILFLVVYLLLLLKTHKRESSITLSWWLTIDRGTSHFISKLKFKFWTFHHW